jgi:hypothetical protein
MTEAPPLSDRQYVATKLLKLFRDYLQRAPEDETPVNEQQNYSSWYYESVMRRPFQPAEQVRLPKLLEFAAKCGALPNAYHALSFTEIRERLIKELANDSRI